MIHILRVDHTAEVIPLPDPLLLRCWLKHQPGQTQTIKSASTIIAAITIRPFIIVAKFLPVTFRSLRMVIRQTYGPASVTKITRRLPTKTIEIL